MKFLKVMKKCWNDSKPLTNDTFDYLKALVEQEYKKIKIKRFLRLNKYGEYDVEFLFLLFISRICLAACKIFYFG